MPAHPCAEPPRTAPAGAPGAVVIPSCHGAGPFIPGLRPARPEAAAIRCPGPTGARCIPARAFAVLAAGRPE